MRLVRIFACALIGLAAMEVFAQNEPNSSARLPAVTPATTNLFTTNVIRSTNLFATNTISRPLALMEAIQMALSNNFDIRIEQISPLITRESIESAKGAYDPVVGVTGVHRHSKGATDYFDTDTLNFGLNGILPSGANYTFGVVNSENRKKPFGGVPLRNDQGNAVASITQPLLRDFWIDQTRYQIAFNRKQLKIDELGFRVQVLATISQVEQQYYTWIAARESVRVQEEAVSLARQQAREYSIRTQIGVTKPLDEQRFESQAASSEADLLNARRNLKETENTLINLISHQYETWQGLALDPLDQLPTIPREFDTQLSWNKAFQKRPDLHQLIINLEQLGLAEKRDYNRLFPNLDLTGSYGYDSVGTSWGSSFSDLGDANKPAWSVQLSASFPIGNRSARANLRATRLQIAQANERLKKARQTIMFQVENAIIDARIDWERIPATRAAREYAASALEAGQQRLAVGTATSLEILQLQRDLTSARSAEIAALVDYNRAVTVLLEREGTLLDERGLTINAY